MGKVCIVFLTDHLFNSKGGNFVNQRIKTAISFIQRAFFFFFFFFFFFLRGGGGVFSLSDITGFH